MGSRTLLEFYPLDFDYVSNKEGKATIRIFGTTKDHKKVIVIDKSLSPYFYAIISPKDTSELVDSVRKLKVVEKEKVIQPKKVEVVKKKNVGSETTALKISVNHPSEIPILKNEVSKFQGCLDFIEFDIPFRKRYVMDKKMLPMTLLRVVGEDITNSHKTRADYVIVAEEMDTIDGGGVLSPKIISFDIETYNPLSNPRPNIDPIISISFASNDGNKKVITWKKFNDAPKYVEFVESERELLEKTVSFIKQQEPDFIVGYNSDSFDLPYINTRCGKYKIPIDLGIDDSNLRVSRGGIGFVSKIKGIVHIDLLTFVRNILGATMKTESYNLNSVSKELIGESKKDGVDGDSLYKLWESGEEGVRKITAYNMQDSIITLKLMEHLSHILYELTKLIGQSIFDVSRMTYGKSVEHYLMGRSSRFNEFIPNKSKRSISESRSFEGAYVHKPKPGLYDDIVIYDFRSLYPSIIVSHNVGPTTIFCDCCSKGYETPEINGKTYSFCKQELGFIPTVLKELIARRITVKEILKKVGKDDEGYSVLSARSYALKTVANSTYGYLGFSKSRWYCLECAESITAWGRHYIKKVIVDAEKHGFDVIYSDTDSIVLSLKDKTKEDSKKFAQMINKSLPEDMELEFQGFYPRALFVAAKKRYALVDEEDNIIVKGFEFVRRDVSKISKATQMGVLKALLLENSEDLALQIIKNTIDRLKSKEVELDEIIINTQLTRDIEHYEAVGPHVAAAIKARKGGVLFEAGQIIKYIITKGEGSISDRSYTVKDYGDKGLSYDPDYYINNQVLPAVERIFEVLGYTKDQLKGKFQTKLGGFF